ncbi:MAG: flavin reductase family protein [Planctomycetota bacterium]
MAQSKAASSASSDAPAPEVLSALGLVPSGKFVLTAQHEDRRAGMLVHWVQQVCAEPPMISVAVAKGKPIMPLISESRKFALCQLGESDRLMHRKFAQDSDLSDDPFLGFDLVPSKLGSVPIMSGSLAYFECELSCHMDVEGDHDLFVGQVHAAGSTDGTPRVCYNAGPAQPESSDSNATPSE